MGELRRAFRPEFLNRLDEIILFKPLTKENLNGIIEILMQGLRKRMADKTLKLDVTDAAKSLIIDLRNNGGGVNVESTLSRAPWAWAIWQPPRYR